MPLDAPNEEGSALDQEALPAILWPKVCLAHHGLITSGKPLNHRSHGWINGLPRQRGWGPEAD